MSNNLIIFLNSLILIGLSVGVPTISILLVMCFKIKMTATTKMILYSFASGLIIILGSVGFIGEAIEHLSHNLEAINVQNIFTKIGIIVGGAIIGSMLMFFIRWLALKNKKEIHKHHCMHKHNDHITNYSDIDCKTANKKNAIILLMGHRILDGISLGLLCTNMTVNNQIGSFSSWGMIITFIIHLIPTSIIVYLTQLDIYKSKSKAFLYSVFMLLLTTPFVIIGAFFSKTINSVYWLMPFLYSISGTIMIILSIVEIIPEFIHNKQMETKKWYASLLTLISGIILGLILICIHTH